MIETAIVVLVLWDAALTGHIIFYHRAKRKRAKNLTWDDEITFHDPPKKWQFPKSPNEAKKQTDHEY